MRPTTSRDASILFDWVNSPETRAVSLQSLDPIPWDRHLSWLNERLADPNTVLWIAEANGRPAGQVRIQGGKEGLEVSVYVAPQMRKRGTARLMLEEMKKHAGKLWPGQALIAKVMPDNSASLRLFEGAGYVLRAREMDHVVLVCEQ